MPSSRCWSLLAALAWLASCAQASVDRDHCGFDVEYLVSSLHSHIKEQELAIKVIEDKVRKWDDNGRSKPLVMYFNGPTGVGKTHTANVIAQHVNRTASPFSTFNSSGSNLVRVSVHPDLDCNETMAMIERRLERVVESSSPECVKVLILDEVDVLLEGVQAQKSKEECEGCSKPNCAQWLKSCACKQDSSYYNFMSVLEQFHKPTYLTRHLGGNGKILPLENLIVILTGTHSRNDQRHALAQMYCTEMNDLASSSCRSALMKRESFSKQLDVARKVMAPRLRQVFREDEFDQEGPYSALVPFFYFFQKELKSVTQHLADEYVKPDYRLKLGTADFEVTDEVTTAITQRSDPALGARDVKQKFLYCIGTFMHNLWDDTIAWTGKLPVDERFTDVNVTIKLADAVESPRLVAGLNYAMKIPDDRFKSFVHTTRIENAYTLDDCTAPGLINFDKLRDGGSSTDGDEDAKFPSSAVMFPTTTCDGESTNQCSPRINLEGFRKAFGASTANRFDAQRFAASGSTEQVAPLENFFKRIAPWLNTTSDSSQLYEHSSFSILLGGEDNARASFVKNLLDALKSSFASSVSSIDLTRYHNQQYALNHAFRDEVACSVKRCKCADGDDTDGACLVVVNMPPLTEDAWKHTIFPVLDTTSPAVDAATPLGTEVVSTRQVIFLFSMDYSLKEWKDFCQQLHFKDQKGFPVPSPGSLYDSEAGLGPLRGRVNEIWSLGGYKSVCDAPTKQCFV